MYKPGHPERGCRRGPAHRSGRQQQSTLAELALVLWQRGALRPQL